MSAQPSATDNPRRTLVALLEDKPGVLSRVTNLFRRRNYNIDSLTVGASETKGLSQMTVVVHGDDSVVEQVIKQLHKLINVTKVTEITDSAAVIRELALIKVHATSANRTEIKQLVDIFRARIIDVSHESMTIEITGTEDKVDSFLDMIKPFGLKALTRTGRVAMMRGSTDSNGTS